MTESNPIYAWMNGKIIPWEDAKVHVRTEAFMRGASIFEGIRAYRDPEGKQLYIFKLPEHLDRMFNVSMKILRLHLKWTPQDTTSAILELLRANNTRGDVHIRPQAYFGVGQLHGFDSAKIETGCVITTEERPPKPSLEKGISAGVCTWRRIDDDVMPPRVKAAANYMNSRYATMDARLNGFDYAIILNRNGKVSEGPGACLMIVRSGKVITPPVSGGILEGVTRSTLLDLFQREMGVEVVEREVDRTELYIADEVFFCGTGEELLPVVSIDRYQVGSGQRGPIAKAMQEIYFGITRGQNLKYREWLTPVYR